MRLLLDTHAFLWFINGDPKLSGYARQVIENRANERLLSIASLWEISIKASIGKLWIGMPFTEMVAVHLEGNAIKLLHIESEHLDILMTLPFHHKDPFDRLIIAQVQHENIPILSRDEIFDEYVIQRLWN